MDILRQVFLFVAIGAFIGLGICAMVGDEWKAGIASILLAIVNGLLLS